MTDSITSLALVFTLLVTVGFIWYVEGRGRWRARLEDRFVYGVPWGTVVTVTLIVGFYLLAQSGFRNWAEPVTFAFVSWSYFYPTGMLTAGIAHGSPQHLASNMAATLVIGPIVEYAWGHYPPSSSGTRTIDSSRGSRDVPPEPESDHTESRRTDGGSLELGSGDGSSGGWLSRPWIRALVVFPAASFGVAFFTVVFSLGPGLGFSGAVFAFVGFAVVTYPITTVVGITGASALGTLYTALSQPVLRETIDPGTPGPPEWAGIGFQAHLLGFLIGVLLAIALLWHRERDPPSAERVFFAALLVGLVQSLWLIVWPGGDDVFVLYRGAGVVLVLGLTALLTVAVTGSDRPILDVGDSSAWVPTRRQISIGLLVVCTAFVALPSLFLGLTVVDDDTVPGTGAIAVGDYTVTYEENVTSGQTPAVDLGDEELFASQQSGVIVVSDERELWTVGVRPEILEYEGNATVAVGGIGWHETVHAQRSGWDVLGNDTAYVVDLAADGETTRSFESDPVAVPGTLEGHTLEVAPTPGGFEIRVYAAETVEESPEETAPVPEIDDTTTVGNLEFATRETTDGVGLFVETAETEVQIAEREEYG